MDFYEKAHFVKADVAVLSWRPSATAFCPSRYASIRTFGEPPSSMALCTMRSVFSELHRGAAIFRSVSPLERVDQVHMAQSPHIRSEALCRASTDASTTL